MVRAAIVGLGWWGRTLVSSVQAKSSDIKFVCGYTRSRHKVEDFCRDQHIGLVDDYADIVSDPEVDAVVLATPHSQHEIQVKQAAAAGKHVFVEKPFTLTSSSAEATIKAAEAADIVLAVGFNRRFHPSMAELRNRVRDGRLGVVGTCIAEQTAMTAAFLPPEAWRSNPTETPAGAMTGIGIHAVDSMIDLFGHVTEVYCVNTRRAAMVDDTTSVMLRLANGVTGIIAASLSTAAHYRFTVYGSKGLAEIDSPSLDEFRFRSAPAKPPSGQPIAEAPEVIRTPGFDTVHAELIAFAKSVSDGTPYPIPVTDILHGAQVFEAVVESAQIGRPLAVG